MSPLHELINNNISLPNLPEPLGSVSQTCKVGGFSQGNFYRFREIYEAGSDLALQPPLRRPSRNPLGTKSGLPTNARKQGLFAWDTVLNREAAC